MASPSRGLLSGRNRAIDALLVLWLFFGTGHTFCCGQTMDAGHPRSSVHAHAFLEEGRRELQRGNYLRAIRLLSAAIRNGADGYKLRSQAYLRNGDRDRALTDITRCLSLQPSDPEAYLLRGDLAMENGNANAALQDYQAAVKLAPSSAEAYVSRGLGYVTLERYRSAVRDFEIALGIDPGNRDALSNLGVANMVANRPNAARECFLRAMTLEKDSRWRERLSAWLSGLPQESESVQDAELPPEDDSSDSESDGTEKNGLGSPGDRQHTERKPLRPVEPSSRQGDRSTHPMRVTSHGKWTQLSGRWDTTYRGARITMDVSHAGTTLSGIMHIHGPFGKDDTYHFNGTVDYEGNIRAAHHSGHLFEGRIGDNGRIAGVLTTKFGTTIPIDFSAH
jgi:Flp pilus assembly protein TadD